MDANLDDLTTLYTGVRFEPSAFHNDGGRKEIYTFDKSLSRLRTAGFTRHPRPQEVFSLLIADLEGRLTPEQKAIADDMLKSFGEWLGLALERNGDIITVYLDPEGLVWNNSTEKYDQQNFQFISRRDFHIDRRIESERWIDLDQFSDDVVKYLSTRPFAQLPEKMKRGDLQVQLYLPLDGTIWPVSRGLFECPSYEFNCYIYNYGASRGVVPLGAEK